MTLNNFKNLEAFNLSKRQRTIFENRNKSINFISFKELKNYKDFLKNLILTLIKIIR